MAEAHIITSQMLKDLRLGLSESLTDFGLTLKRAIDPRASRGYSRQYISRLEHGKDAITIELEAAYWNIAAALDDSPDGTGGAVIRQIMAQPGQVPEGVTPFLPRSVRIAKCQRPGCPVWFIRIGNQKYHDPDCRKKHYNNIRKKG